MQSDKHKSDIHKKWQKESDIHKCTKNKKWQQEKLTTRCKFLKWQMSKIFI